MQPFRRFLSQPDPRFLAGLFLGALLIRIAFVLYFHSRFPHFIFPDSVQYDRVAENLLAGRGFAVEENRVAARPPLYPLFMILCGRNLLIIRIVQAVLSAATAVLAFQFCRTLFASEAAAKLAGVAAALDPFLIFFSGLALTETLYTFILLLALQCLARLARIPATREAVLAGALLGLGILLRPALVFFPFFLVPCLFLFIDSRRQAVAASATLLMAAAATVSPWTCRNYRLLHVFVPTTTQGGESLWEANNPMADGGPMMDQPIWPPGSEFLPEIERDRFLRAAALQFIRENPGDFLRLAVRKFMRFWNFVPNTSAYRTPLYMGLSLAATAPAFLLLLLGLGSAFRTDGRRALVCLAPIVYTAGLHLAFVGSVRYRIPVDPCLLSFAALGAARFLQLDTSPPSSACPNPS